MAPRRKRKNDFNNPFKMQTLVDPAVDPDVGGTLVSDAVNNAAAAGALATSTNNVIESADGSYDFSSILTSLQGVQEVPNEFIDDRDGFNRSILLNEGTTGNLGGGIGTSQYTGNRAYLYGESGKITTANDPLFNIGGDDNALDIIVELTNFTPFTASVWTGQNGATGTQPNDWLLREKRLIVSGHDSHADKNNDWAVRYGKTEH